jgi:hypothetical protein
MNERSFIVKPGLLFTSFCPFSYDLSGLADILQDFVSAAASTACCDMTGTGRSGANSSPNGVGVGCAMNWQIATTTLRMQVAYTAVSILLRPFSSESTRSPYID